MRSSVVIGNAPLSRNWSLRGRLSLGRVQFASPEILSIATTCLPRGGGTCSAPASWSATRSPALLMTSRLTATSHRLIVVGVLLVGAVAGTTAWLISAERATDLAHGQQEVTDFAQAMAEQTSRTLLPIDLALRRMRDRLTGSDSPFDGPAPASSKAMSDWLAEQSKSLPQASALLVADPDGHLLNVSGQFPPPRLTVSGRDYFARLHVADDHNLFVGEPAQSLVDGSWTIVLARRVDGPGGDFAGIVAAAVALANLEDFYRAVTPENKAIALLRRDRTVMLRYPPPKPVAASKSPPQAPGYWLPRDGDGHDRSPGYPDGIARLVSERPLPDFPLVIDASMSEEAALSRWHHQTSLLLVIACLVSAGTIFLLSIFGRQFARLERSETALAQRNAELEAGRRKFDAVLDNISQGLTFFGGDYKLNVCNRRYREIYRLSAEQTRIGSPLADILAHRAAGGTFVPMTQADYLARLETDFRASKPYDVIDNLSDGRSVSMHFQPLPDGGWVATHEDITERSRTEASLAFMARHDALTALPNRTLFQERLEEAISMTRHGSPCALLCLDLDRFKVINATLGHPVGDSLLRAVAGRLSACIREADTVARLGGDEFAIVQVGLKSNADSAKLADRIIASLQQPYTIGGHRIVAGASIGISVAPSDGSSPEMLLKNADIALYLAKGEGRGSYQFFEAEMDARAQALRVVELDLRNALPANDFELYYQPILHVRSGKVVGFEALIRWNHPARGLISPADFIPIAEDTGLIVPMGEWVLRTACLEAAGWPSDIDIAVNLSPAQFKAAHLHDSVLQALEISGLDPRRLVL
jgi:diguanylate cyclase (GGDEF)-like protein